MTITYFVDNKLGGVTSLNYNLVANPIKDIEARQRIIHIDQQESSMSRADIHFPAHEEIFFKYTTKDNYYHVLKKLSRVIGDADGALIVNYETEMAMLDHYPAKQTVYQLVHDSFNVGLAKHYGHVVDAFICHNSVIRQELLAVLPHRASSIFYLPHGVPVPLKTRDGTDAKKRLKLLFLGRMTKTKGIFDLPRISALLRMREVEFEWLCIGNGPELNDLKKVWDPVDKVTFASPSSSAEVLAMCAEQDVFVLPTKFEGSPVSLLETMSVGLVPVISKIPGGITDIVSENIGFAIGMDDNDGFADAIARLYHDRNLLNRLSNSCRKKIIAEFDVRTTALNYHALFLRYREFYTPKVLRKLKVGARLDQPFMPTWLTRFIRILFVK